ncbi:MBL fold metallo-hydrolase [Actinoplanes sp. NPDC048796]|uniref:MBL fold metallo-hydrolase n=1 Tax=Actinoplanes sp. NPDC048796 TaxID=3155640 RepID=UPI0033D6448D
MRITKFGHSCLRVEGEGVLVIDPGNFSERSAVDGADAVLITHEHPDHVDHETIASVSRIYAHPAVLATLTSFRGETVAVEPGQRLEVAGYQVTAHGGQHAVIHPDIPRIVNLAYLVADANTNLYHPGDSFTVPEDTTVDTLFAPINAPWMRASESIDFIRAVRPGRAFALHDGLLNANGRKIYGGLSERLSGTAWAHVAPGTVID